MSQRGLIVRTRPQRGRLREARTFALAGAAARTWPARDEIVRRFRTGRGIASRQAFTIIELLVTLGVIGLLTALLLPAVQSARESARRIQCESNLCQIGVALHTYQTAYGVFPCGGGAALFFHPTGGSPRHFSPFVYLLPYLDHVALYDSVNFDVRTYDADPMFEGPENQTAFNKKIELFLCPSDSWPSGGPGGRTNYRVSVGTGPRPWPPTNNGAFPPTIWTKPAAFVDGLSATAGVSERIKGDGDPLKYSPGSDVWEAAMPGFDPTLEQLTTLCIAPPLPIPPHDSLAGSSWFHGGFRSTWYNHGVTPNNLVPDCTTALNVRPGSIPGLFAARSMHPGGIDMMMMDGSVRFIADSIDLAVWRALGSRDGGESVDRVGF